MATTLHEAPTANAYQTTLNGSITDSDTTVTLNSVTNLVAPGVLVIDRQDGSGNDTPSLREYITFTGISGSDLTGVTRGVAGSTAQTHSSGALVEATTTVTHWGDMVDYLQSEHDATGKHVISTATINYTETHNLAVTSIASIAYANVARISAPSVDTWTVGGLNVNSNASVNLIEVNNMILSSTASIYEAHISVLQTSGLSVTVHTKGQYLWTQSKLLATSLVTTTNTTPIAFQRAHQNLTILNFWAGVQSAPSLAAAQFDILYASGPTGDYSTIFAVKPQIDIGEYTTDSAAQAASIQLTSLASGIILKPAVDVTGDAGYLTMQLQVETRT